MNSATGTSPLHNFCLNRVASRLLDLKEIPVSSGTPSLSQGILDEILHWNGPKSHDSRVWGRLIRLGEAEDAVQFANALRPFLGPLAWDSEQAELEGPALWPQHFGGLPSERTFGGSRRVQEPN